MPEVPRKVEALGLFIYIDTSAIKNKTHLLRVPAQFLDEVVHCISKGIIMLDVLLGPYTIGRKKLRNNEKMKPSVSFIS